MFIIKMIYMQIYMSRSLTTRKINFREGQNPSLMAQISVTSTFSDGFSDKMKSINNFNVANI
jgi:hypothetical protein